MLCSKTEIICLYNLEYIPKDVTKWHRTFDFSSIHSSLYIIAYWNGSLGTGPNKLGNIEKTRSLQISIRTDWQNWNSNGRIQTPRDSYISLDSRGWGFNFSNEFIYLFLFIKNLIRARRFKSLMMGESLLFSNSIVFWTEQLMDLDVNDPYAMCFCQLTYLPNTLDENLQAGIVFTKVPPWRPCSKIKTSCAQKKTRKNIHISIQKIWLIR